MDPNRRASFGTPTTVRAMHTLASARVSAESFDRAYGKPGQALEHSAQDNSLEGFWQEGNATVARPKEFGNKYAMGRESGFRKSWNYEN
jgi:hypothetical protein